MGNIPTAWPLRYARCSWLEIAARNSEERANSAFLDLVNLAMRAGIALGSNIEPRLAYLQAARRRIDLLHAGPQPVLCSKVYETSPIGCPPGSLLFLNAVLEVVIREEPQEFLEKLQSIERTLGRLPSTTRNSPRVIDLDLLYCESVVISTPRLTLPHPRIAERLFVLRPLADIRPKLILPTFSRTVEELVREHSNAEHATVYCNSIY
jgi:2-amino-4-hydroxy-6-hydroxymethyldihydropteridine diphosphokinase